MWIDSGGWIEGWGLVRIAKMIARPAGAILPAMNAIQESEIGNQKGHFEI